MLNKLKERLKFEREIVIKVKVRAGAPANKIKSVVKGVLKIDIKARAEKGKANKELIGFLAKKLEIDENNVKILTGLTARFKTVKIKN